jgi:cytochrome c peroxidase
MLGAFATPTLRCVASRPAFMHTGQFRTLEEVVGFFNAGGSVGGFPGKNEIAPLRLTAQDRSDLVAFLGTLEGPGPPSELLVAP